MKKIYIFIVVFAVGFDLYSLDIINTNFTATGYCILSTNTAKYFTNLKTIILNNGKILPEEHFSEIVYTNNQLSLTYKSFIENPKYIEIIFVKDMNIYYRFLRIGKKYYIEVSDLYPKTSLNKELKKSKKHFNTILINFGN